VSCGSAAPKRLGTVQEIVADYIRRVRPGAKLELSFYASRATMAEAIRVGANALTVDGKRHDHQRRIPGKSLAELARRLLESEPEVKASTTFADLHDLVKHLAEGVHAIGDLTIYDTALRIGAKLGLPPQEVYLHAGTRKGAAAFRIDTSAETIAPTDLPREFRKLEPFEIEDILCMYKADLHRLARAGKL
jgi:hypothetical protein